MKTTKALSKITFNECPKCGGDAFKPIADGSKLKCLNPKCGHILAKKSKPQKGTN